VLGALLPGCGGEHIDGIRLLQMNPAPIIANPSGTTGAVRMGVSLTGAGGRSVAPPVAVPNAGSLALGTPTNGGLANGLQLPASGPDWVSWDPVLRRVPNRPERRWATDRLLAFLLAVLRDYRLAHPDAPQIVVGDLSRPGGGPFGSKYGGLGHRSHANGLDVDVYYPRLDRTLQPPGSVADVDRALAQDLVSRFVAAGAQFTFVGLHVGLGGPAGVVQAIDHHDDHVHVRIANVRQ
jgi:Penicillin-insensitive murein endopeptidase